MIISVGSFSPPRLYDAERITVHVKGGGIWTLYSSIEKYKYWFPFLSSNTFILWKNKGWWRSNNILPSALSSEDEKKREIPQFSKSGWRFFSFSIHISFIRSCQFSGGIRGTGTSQLLGCLWSWHGGRNGNGHHQHIPKDYSFCTAPCQRNGLFLHELPGMREGLCGKSSIIPRTLVSAVLLPDRGKKADAVPQKEPQECVFSPHPPATCAHVTLSKSVKSPWIPPPPKTWNEAKEPHPRRENPAGSWPLHNCSELCQGDGLKEMMQRAQPNLQSRALSRGNTHHPHFENSLPDFSLAGDSLLRDLQPERKVNKNSHGWLAAGSLNCMNCGSDKVPESFIN